MQDRIGGHSLLRVSMLPVDKPVKDPIMCFATPGISDAGLDIQIDFFEGLDAQVGSSDAAQASRLRSAPPQCCCAAGARPFINEI